MPPTTPPTMAPTGVELDSVSGSEVEVEPGAPPVGGGVAVAS
jgi:hypothetical protein